MKLDPAAREYVQTTHRQRAQAEAEVQAKPKRETRLRPHETERKARMMNITFPSGAWPETIRKFARLRGLRPGDFIVWCISYATAQIQDGAVTAPSGRERRQHHKACEWMNLPWEPRGDKEIEREKQHEPSTTNLTRSKHTV